MMPLLVFRERVKNFYQRYDSYLLPAVKFVFAFIAFQTINKEIGYHTKLESLPVVLLLSLISAITPSAVMVLIAALMVVLHVYTASPILSIIIVMLLMIIYFLFVRFTPGLGYVLLALPILYFLRIPYVIPILLGIVSTPVAIIPTVCGVLIYYIFLVMQTAITMQVNTTVDDILQLYTFVIDSLIGNRQMIMSMAVFAIILIVVYYVRKMRFDYAFEISIAAGALTGILGFLIRDLIFDRSDQIFIMIIGMILSAGIVYAVHFFELTLDYSGVEHAQFEDDVYYYYVKAVPKVTVTAPQRKIKRINEKKSGQGVYKETTGKNDTVTEDDYDEDDYNYTDNEEE